MPNWNVMYRYIYGQQNCDVENKHLNSVLAFKQAWNILDNINNITVINVWCIVFDYIEKEPQYFSCFTSIYHFRCPFQEEITEFIFQV